MGLVRSDFFETVNDEAWQNMGNELVVFTHYYVQEEGRAYWVTAAAAPPVIESEPIKPVAHSYREAEADDYEAWQTLFGHIQEGIASGEVTKVVASRKVTLESDTPFDSTSIIGRLVAQNQGAFIFAYNKGDAVFLGASPEVLVRKRGQDFMSYALAGTMKKMTFMIKGRVSWRMLKTAMNTILWWI